MINNKIRIRNCELSTRIVMPPMATSKGIDKKVSDELCEYYALRSANPNVGLIITEHSYIDSGGIASNKQLSIADDDTIEGFKKLTDVIHTSGDTKVFAQISHAGGNGDLNECGILLAPSALEYKKGMAKQMSKQDIEYVTECFKNAARRAKEAGFDGVEIHSAHGYLLNQFYSPITNKRDDEYGCSSIENRLRFLCEVIEKIRKEVGNDYPISVRLGGCDYMDGGSTLDDCKDAATILNKYDIDLLSVTGGLNGYILKENKEYGYFKEMSKIFKDNMDIPVLLTGGVTQLDQAEELLHENYADLIGIGRALMINPNL